MDSAAVIFGRRVRTLRLGRCMTQEQLGHAAKLDYKHLSAIERGAKTPSFDAIDRLAAALSVDHWQLFLPDRKLTATLDRDVSAVIATASQISSDDIAEFLRTLRSAVRKLDRKSAR